MDFFFIILFFGRCIFVSCIKKIPRSFFQWDSLKDFLSQKFKDMRKGLNYINGSNKINKSPRVLITN